MVETRRSSAAPVPAGKRPPPSAASIPGKKLPPPSAASTRGKKRPLPSAASIRGKKRPKVRSFPAPPTLHATDPATGAFSSSPEWISTTPRGRRTAETELLRNLRAHSSQTTAADASSIAAASILASLSVLGNNLAVPLMASNVKNVQQGWDIPSLPSGCDSSDIRSPDNDTNRRIGKEYTTSGFDLGENVFKVCKGHRETPQNLASPTLPSPDCQALNDAFEPGICSTSDIQASVDTHRRITSSTSCHTEGTSKKDAKKKMPLSFTNQGVVVGENASKWNTRVGHLVRSYVPIDITDFKRTPQNFLDDVWNALKEEFDFGSVDPIIVRESSELGYSQMFQTMKMTLRNEILRKAASVQEAIEACPIGIDPGHWENFVKRELKTEVIAANLRNKTNKQKSSIGHTLGRCTQAQNNHIKQQKHPEKDICRTEDWLRAHEKPDGTPLDSAKEKYDLDSSLFSLGISTPFSYLSFQEAMAPGGIRSRGSRTVAGSQQVVGSQQVASSQPNSSSRLVASSQATAGSQSISGSRVVAGSRLVASSPRMDESLSSRLCSTNEVVAGGGRPSCGSQYVAGNQIVTASYSKESNMGSTGESQKKKNVRKKALNKALENFIDSGGGKPKIEIPIGKLRPLGKWAKEWVTEMGIIVRQNIPLSLHYWKDVTSELKITLYDKVLAKFDVDMSLEHVQEAVDDSLKDRFKARRHNLHLYYLSLGDQVDKHDHPESSTTQDEWEALCAHFESQDFKKSSERNKRNKKDLRVNHHGGCKSFVRHRFDQQGDPETGEEPDRVEFYRNMRRNSKKGWIADEAEQNYEKTVEILSQPVEEGAKKLTDGQIVEKVLDKYVIGLERAEVPPSRKAKVINNDEVNQLRMRTEVIYNDEVNQLRMRTEEQDRELNVLRAWKAYQEQLRNAQQQKINAHAEKIGAQAKKQEETDQILNALRQKLGL